MKSRFFLQIYINTEFPQLDSFHLHISLPRQVMNDQLLLSAQMIRKVASQESARPDHKTADALFFIILSHGCSGYIFGTDGGKVELDEIFSYFDGEKCFNLIQKPKIFIIQACQGGTCITTSL